ncbi:MAG: hypothetical protein AMJ81_05240 [Phycisphaerae bacterium SM23_33]|nr:MAG: hypothetical protein AMJ81_05240 [Phycisphaerae bacterium SM23_33]
MTPLLFNAHTARSFEEDRVPMLRSLAILLAAALLIWGMGRPRAARQSIRRVMRSPLAWAATGLAAASLLAALLSVAPRISFWGAYTRSHGAYLSLAYLAVFLGLVFLVRRPARAEQLVSVILLASVPCVVYALLQHLGWDVTLASRPETAQRVFSTHGNPIFLGAYLIMVAPLTLARLLGRARSVFGRRQPTRREARLLPILRLTGYAALFGLQLLVLGLTQSRGPMLGLCAGLCVFGMLMALLRGHRRAAAAIAAATLAALGCLVILNLWAARHRSAGAIPGLGRLGSMLEPHGSGRARLVYWEGAMQLLKADPARSLLGYGPETTYLVYPRFSPPELAHLEGPEPILDRLHNETLESLVTTGALGAVCALLAFGFFFHQVLRRLGLVAKPCRGAGFWCLVLGGGAAGFCGPWVAEGSFRLSGLGLPLGMVAGMVSYLTALAIWPRASAQGGSPATSVGDRELLLIGLLSAVVAHFVEIQFGIAIVATRLLWWTYLAVVVSMRLWPKSSGQAAPDRPPSEPATTGAPARPAAWTPAAVCTGLAMIVLVFSLFRPALGWTRQMPVLAVVLGSTFLAGMAMAVGRGRGKRRRLRSFATATAALVLLFSVVYVPWSGWRPASAVKLVDWVTQQSHATSLLYGAVLLLVLLPAGRAARRRLRGPWRPWGKAAVGLCLLAAAGAAIVPSNLNVSRADCFARQARFYRQAKQYKPAALLYAEASRLQPRQDHYLASRALCLTAQARSLGRSGPTRDLFQQATDLLGRAIGLSGRDFRHYRALARTHHLESLLSEGTAERAACVRRAEQAYLRALSLAPNHMKMRNEWASLWLDHAEHARAAQILRQALDIDPSWGPTRVLLAKVHAARGDTAEALAELDRATATDTAEPETWWEKARVLAELDRLAPAVAAADRAVKADPRNAAYRRTLAELYLRSGKDDLARVELVTAIRLAAPSERPDLIKALAELEKQHPPR